MGGQSIQREISYLVLERINRDMYHLKDMYHLSRCPSKTEIAELGDRMRRFSVFEWAIMNVGTILVLASIRNEYLEVASVVGLLMLYGNRWLAEQRGQIFNRLERETTIAIEVAGHFRKENQRFNGQSYINKESISQ